MRRTLAEYLSATRHPWASALFLLPLLAIYEAGVLYLAESAQPTRNGADVWLRNGLSLMGLSPGYWPPVFLAVALLVWSGVRRKDRPKNVRRVWVGMAVESLVWATALLVAHHTLGPLLDRLNVAMQTGAPAEPAIDRVVGFLGAGLYEETLFRLLFLSVIGATFHLAGVNPSMGTGLGILLSSLAFAAVHHLGPSGEAYQGFVFLFRTLAGLYFAVLYQARGFGVAVGTHAGYDILVGVVLTRA
jgi:membrane protease YdiL (CAAX protease family)